VQTSVERADPLVGSIFDKRFRVEERIAAGGFGAIYRATHVKSGHPIALKVLLRELARDLGVVARFRREGDALTTLRNPHTITAYELGQAADKTLFIVMELLYGESLFERYKAHGPLDWKRMIKIGREVCESLEEAHALGIVHRDLKPTNIHLEHDGSDHDYVKVLDFGIAKILGSGAAELTNAGQMIGTIDYMSPEQMVGGTVTGQSDIYTLGIVMYEMIAGTPPFGESMTAAQALAAVMKTRPKALYLRAPVPEELDRIVMRCLERDTRERYQTVAELRHDLERLLEGVAPTRAQLVGPRPSARADEEATELTPVPRLGDWAQESTTLVPPPAQLVAASRRKSPMDEATQLTPPPAQLLELARRADRDSDVELTQLTPPPEGLLAGSRRNPVRAADFEATQLTPPPDKLLAQSREWSDDDEHLPTQSVRRGHADSDDDHERVTAIASLADIAQRVAQTREQARDDERAVHAATDDREAPAGSDEHAATTGFSRPSEQVMTAAFPRRPDSSPGGRKPGPPMPPAAPPARRSPSGPPVAPAASRTMAPSEPPGPAIPRTKTASQPPGAAIPRTKTASQPPGPAIPRTMTPAQLPGPAIPRTMTPAQLPGPAIPRTNTPSQPPGLGPPRTMSPGQHHAPAVPRAMSPGDHRMLTPQTPIPQLASAPVSTSPPTLVEPYMPVVAPVAPPPVAPAPKFDMGRMAARESLVRRLISIAALVLAAAVAAILAMRL
jgi:serine/threonine protein kinase